MRGLSRNPVFFTVLVNASATVMNSVNRHVPLFMPFTPGFQNALCSERRRTHRRAVVLVGLCRWAEIRSTPRPFTAETKPLKGS